MNLQFSHPLISHLSYHSVAIQNLSQLCNQTILEIASGAFSEITVPRAMILFYVIISKHTVELVILFEFPFILKFFYRIFL